MPLRALGFFRHGYRKLHKALTHRNSNALAGVRVFPTCTGVTWMPSLSSDSNALAGVRVFPTELLTMPHYGDLVDSNALAGVRVFPTKGLSGG